MGIKYLFRGATLALMIKAASVIHRSDNLLERVARQKKKKKDLRVLLSPLT